MPFTERIPNVNFALLLVWAVVLSTVIGGWLLPGLIFGMWDGPGYYLRP